MENPIISFRKSSGKEPNVLRAYKPEDLLGVHAGLVVSAIHPDQHLLYMVYAPIHRAETTPFGLRAEPASKYSIMRR